jgi:hypothetical protein
MAVGANLALDLQGKGLLSLLAGRALAEDAPAKVTRTGGLVRIPKRGTLYVASDFHGRLSDFQTWLKRTELEKRLKNEEDTVALLLGDAVDIKPNDAEADPEGDTRIVKALMALKDALGEAKERLVVLQGNHEWEVANISEKFIAKAGWDPALRKEIVKRIYSGVDGGYYQQFNFIERIDEASYTFLRNLPVVAVTESGIVGVHAGPSRAMKAPKAIVKRETKVIEELVWDRPTVAMTGGYTPEDVSRFLLLLWSAKVLLCGHTPLGSLPKTWIKNGVGVQGNQQLILATSYGSTGGEKSHLVLPLDKSCTGVNAFAPGKEIRKLAKE